MSTKKYRKRAYGQQGEDLVLKRILSWIVKLPKEYEGFYMDLGAYHPSKHSVTRLLHDRGWWGVNVDMNQKSVDLFTRKRPNDISVRAAVGNKEGSITGYFQDRSISLINSCDPSEIERIERKGKPVREEVVPLMTATSILENYAPSVSKIDFLNVDVQRMELEALEGLNFERYKPSVVAVEIYEKSIDHALKSDVANLMRSLGYSPVASCVITMFFVRNELIDGVSR